MRVEVSSLTDFFTNLENQQVFNRTIWYDKAVNNPQDHIQQVSLQFSCIVDMGEGQYHLQGSEYCGLNYETADDEQEGTKHYEELLERLQHLSTAYNLHLKPGLLTA